jgi:hypothetical protein
MVVVIPDERPPVVKADMRRPKKLIATGWDMANSDTLLAQWAEMEARPFDGVVVPVNGENADGPFELRWAFKCGAWDPDWFSAAAQRLARIPFRRFTDNFVLVNANPGTVDWFNDNGWADIVEHCRIAAGVAKEAGFKGIIFDPEPYFPPNAQLKYAAQCGYKKHSFADYNAMAHIRGRQVMRAIVKEYPEITMLCYFMNSVFGRATGCADPKPALYALGSSCDLYPAFIDGWLDVLPETATLVDGCELAYCYNSAEEYLEARALIKEACQDFVRPKNRAKYRAQVQVGYGCYIDAYINPRESRWYVDGLGGPRVDRLRENVATALRLADEYVWIYGEQYSWWPTPDERVLDGTWPEKLPGCEAALRCARDPDGYARDQIAQRKQSGEFANRLENGEMREGAVDAPPTGWNAWQHPDSSGTLTWDPALGVGTGGSARIEGVSYGCIHQAYDVTPGQRYVVRADRLLQGNGIAFLRVRWQDKDRKWIHEPRDPLLFCCGPRDQWSELLTTYTVPEDAVRSLVLLSVRDQRGVGDVAWFDNVELCELT